MPNQAAETENDDEQGIRLEDITPEHLPYILQSLARRELVPAPLLFEAVTGFTVTGAMVSVRCAHKSPSTRRLSGFVPDMLTRLAQELGAAGLVEIEISESRLLTRGFAFFLDADTVAEIIPPPPETEKPLQPEYPDSELGKMMQSMQPLLEMMMAPMLARVDELQRTVALAVEARSEQRVRGEALADLLDRTQVARAQKMLEAELQTPEQAIEGHLAGVDKLMTSAAAAGKAMQKYAPKTDPDADAIGRLGDILESPRVGAIGRGILRALGGKIGAPIDTVAVTPEAQRASELPKLFTVVEEASA